MINVNDFKTGVTIYYDDNLYQVLEFQHVKPGKGPAFVRSKLKNLKTGAIIDHTFNAGIKIPKAHVDKVTAQFLYSEGNNYIFMKMDDYSQVEITKDKIEDIVYYLKEGLEVEIISFENEILGVNIPDNIELKVVKAEPGVKGNTTSSAMKDVVLETGLTLKVPIFIEEGETIMVSSKEQKYVSRK